jgi:hypothetical protein
MTFDVHSDKAGLGMGSSIVILTGTLRRGVPFTHNLDAVFHVLTYCSDVFESDEGEVEVVLPMYSRAILQACSTQLLRPLGIPPSDPSKASSY